jgi:2-iminoacetate synthase
VSSARGVTYEVSSVGEGLVCAFRGEQPGVPAAARSIWRGDRAVTEGVAGAAGPEADAARLLAHRLCNSARRDVLCSVDVRGESAAGAAIELGLRAAEQLAEDRRSAALDAADGVLARLRAANDGVEARAAALLGAPLEDVLTAEREHLAELHARSFGREVLLFAPLYLSNACTNDCVYCGFRKSARIPRRKLALDEVVEEAVRLAHRGHVAVDLVTGEIPTDAFVDYVCRATERVLTRSGIRRVSLNLGALSTDQLRRLRDAGGAAYHLYMETYDRELYARIHGAGPKRDMAHRLGGLHRALEAGFETVSLGALLGLRPVQRELVDLARHAALVAADHPDAQLGFSLPRLRPVDPECRFHPPVPVGDEDFVKAMIFLRLEFPRAHLTLTTREPRAVRDLLLPLGVTKLSAGVSTAPGGYGSPGAPGEQFSVSDGRSLAELTRAARAAGLRVRRS